MTIADRPVRSLDDAPTATKIRVHEYWPPELAGMLSPALRFARRHGVKVRSASSMVWAYELAQVVELWNNAPQAEQDAEVEKHRRDREEADARSAAWERQKLLEDVERTDRFLPATELCNRFDIKPGTLRQWAKRGHVRTDTQTLRMGRGGFAKTGDDWEEAQGLRDVRVYHVGDTIDRARQSGMNLGEQHAPDAHNALRMLHHAYRECLRLNVPTDALSKHLLNLARGDDSAFPALETDRDMGLA